MSRSHRRSQRPANQRGLFDSRLYANTPPPKSTPRAQQSETCAAAFLRGAILRRLKHAGLGGASVMQLSELMREPPRLVRARLIELVEDGDAVCDARLADRFYAAAVVGPRQPVHGVIPPAASNTEAAP